MKKTISEMYWFSMISNLFLLACSIAGCIVVLVYTSSGIMNFGVVLETIFVIAIILTFALWCYLLVKDLVALMKDYKAEKSHNYISVIATVIRFKRNTEPESGVQINDTPIVMNIDTSEEILLKLNDSVEIGETYKFNYLKNCRIGEIVKKIE